MNLFSGIIIIYVAFLFILFILKIIYKEYLSSNIKYLYLLYWHIIFINFISIWLYYSIKLESPGSYFNITNNDKIITGFLIIFFPFFVFYLKNFLLIKKFNIKINIITYTLLDFIKMSIMLIFIILVSGIIGFIINRLLIII